MDDSTICLSDAAKSVVSRTLTRLDSILSQGQAAGLKQLAANGQFFDVEAIVILADSTDQTNEATDEN